MGRGGGRHNNMQLIADERSRRITFQNRKKCILKKAYEFSTLCDVDTCVIIYGPSKQSDHRQRRHAELHTYPEKRDEVNRIIEKFKLNNKKPTAKNVHVTNLLHEKKGKNKGVKVSKLSSVMHENKYPTWDERIDEFSNQQLEELVASLDQKVESGKRSLNNLRAPLGLHLCEYEGHNLGMQMPLSIGQHSNHYSQMFQCDLGFNSMMGYQRRLCYDPSGGNHQMMMQPPMESARMLNSIPSSSTSHYAQHAVHNPISYDSYPMNISSLSSQMIPYQVKESEDDDMLHGN